METEYFKNLNYVRGVEREVTWGCYRLWLNCEKWCEVHVWKIKEQIPSCFPKRRVVGEGDAFTGEGMQWCCNLSGEPWFCQGKEVKQ